MIGFLKPTTSGQLLAGELKTASPAKNRTPPFINHGPSVILGAQARKPHSHGFESAESISSGTGSATRTKFTRCGIYFQIGIADWQNIAIHRFGKLACQNVTFMLSGILLSEHAPANSGIVAGLVIAGCGAMTNNSICLDFGIFLQQMILLCIQDMVCIHK